MSTRTILPPPRRKQARLTRVLLREDHVHGFRPLTTGEARVDRAAGVIRGVKVLGLISQNGRRYTLEAVHQAKALYEGVKVFPDHPAKATTPRSVTEPFGWLENIQPSPDGLYADLHLVNPAEPSKFVKDLYWLAENKPDFFALSHNADGEGATDAKGTFVVQRITEVRSVDLVTDGATNRSLFESKTMPQTTLRQLIEASKAKPLFQHLLEMPGDDMPALDMPMDAPPDPAAADGNSLLAQAIAAFITAGSAPDHEMATKLLKLMKPESAVTPDETTVTEDEMTDEEKKKKDEEKKAMESRTATQVAGVVTLTEAKSLVKLAGLTEDAGLLGMLEGSTREKALSLLEWAKGKAPTPARSGVRSQGAGSDTPAPTAKFPTTPEERRKLLMAV